MPWLVGGSADLGPSCKTRLTFDGAGDFSAETPGGRNFHFGIREHAMGAILNGLSLSKLRPFGSGFLIFSDYGRGAIRLSALMEIPVIHVFTHDSIGVGEDGPTHQPIEQLASLRAIPGLITLRPADANEVVEAWRVIMAAAARAGGADSHAAGGADPGPQPTTRPPTALRRGAYILPTHETASRRCCSWRRAARSPSASRRIERLEAEGIRARVVSMPSWELFERYCRDHPEYRDQRAAGLGHGARLGGEQARRSAGPATSAPAASRSAWRPSARRRRSQELQKKFGFTPEHVVAAAKQQIAEREN